MMSPRAVAVLAFAATFAAGAASMHVVDRWSRRTGAPPANDGWAPIADQLQLAPRQREQVDEVFARYQPSTDAIMASLAPSLATISDSIHRDIERVLTPEQRARLQELRRPATFVLRRKTLGGTRVDTLRIPPK